MRSNFGYNGSNPAAKEFVQTVNELVKMLEGLQVDMGANGSTDVVRVDKRGSSMKIDMSQVYIPQPTP